jgi:glycosyltransferase involved in cell wall biosynthesis
MALLSIIIPFYNAEKTLPRTLDSLQHVERVHQSEVEIVFVDDGSTDASRKLTEQFRKENAGFKTLLFKQENRGTSSARNAGLQISTGEWILFLDADDELNLDPIKWIQRYSENTAIGFSGEFYRAINRRLRMRPVLVTQDNFLEIYTSRNPFPTPCLLFKKDRMASLFEPGFSHVEDWLFWMMNPRIFEKMAVFPDTVSARIHIHGDNKSSNQRKHGQCRQKASDQVLETYGTQLTRKQKNNLVLQREIGRLMQREPASLLPFVTVPCSFRLYVKLILYLFFQRINEKVGFYAK